MTLNDIPPKGKLIIIILLISVISITLTFIAGGFELSLLAAGITIILLYFSKSIWLPPDHGKTLIRKISLGVVFFLAGSNPYWSPIVSRYLLPKLKQFFPEITLAASIPSTIVFVFAFLVILIVNYFMRDRTVMKEHKTPIEKEFPEREFKDKLEYFTRVIKNELNNIDLDTNWSDYYFTPIDAEVEIISNNNRKKKITDLLKAIKADKKSQVFLILGDPGSGKSVALRKLAKDLLKEVKTTGKLPIYINLKEWHIEALWSKENPPTPDSLYEFIIANLKSRGDVFSGNFIDQYFKKMFDHGRIFFLLDSFDEIPSVLDADERSWIIDELSDVIYRFLAGSHESRGILSSRIFRKPTQKFKSKTILEIRPLSEIKIEQTLSKGIHNIDKKIFIELFKTRPELVPILRNPFIIALMIEYLKGNNNTFPTTQATLYEYYVKKRLNSCIDIIKSQGLTQEQIINSSVSLSYFLFSSDKYGLEIDLSDLQNKSPETNIQNIEKIINVLVFAKIGRLSSDKKFSFVHRRFNEYFVVLYLMAHPEVIDIESIPNDSRWRDALVLYCEVADNAAVKQIAEYCWKEIRKLATSQSEKNIEQLIRSIHCLRFLNDALRSKVNLTSDFSSELGTLVIKTIESDENMLLKKYCIEATGLLNETHMEKALFNAFETSNPWLYEVAFKSSRHLPKISEQIEYRIFTYIKSLNRLKIIEERNSLLFSTSLSDSFKNIYKKTSLLIYDTQSLLIGLSISFLSYPSFFYLPLLVIFGSWYVEKKFNINFLRNPVLFLFRIFLPLVSISNVFSPSSKTSQIHLIQNNELYVYISVLGAALVFPFFDISILIKTFKLTTPNFLLKNLSAKKFLVNILKGIPPLALLIVFAFLINNYYFMVIMGMLFALIILAIIIFFIIEIINDIKLFNRLKIKFHFSQTIEKDILSKEFYSFETKYFRLKYVRLLEYYSIQAVGKWPENYLPNKNNDASSILIAKLEAKWLGLEK